MAQEKLAQAEQGQAASARVIDAVPPQFRAGNDSWSSLPLRLFSAGNYLSEAGSGVIPFWLKGGLSLASVFYVVSASIDRSRRAEQFQLIPESRRYMSRRVGLESVVREWVACFTLPTIAAGLIVAGTRAGLKRFGGAAGAAAVERVAKTAATEGAAKAGAFTVGTGPLRFLPWAVAALASPLVLKASEEITERWVLDWALRPTLDEWFPPPSVFKAAAGAAGAAGAGSGFPTDESNAATAEAFLPSETEVSEAARRRYAEVLRTIQVQQAPPPPASSNAAASPSLSDIDALIFGDLDPLTRERLQWCFDGNAESAYPEATAAATTAAGAPSPSSSLSSPGGVAGGAGAAAAKAGLKPLR